MFTPLIALMFLLPMVSSEVTLVRSAMAPLATVQPDGSLLPLSPMSPRGFGAEAGRLRFLAVSEVAGVVVVEVADASGGALYAIAGDGSPPLRLAATRSIGFDVALSPDGKRLAYIDDEVAKVVTLSAAAPVTAPVMITPARAAANVPDIRIEDLRWLDDQTLAYARVTYHRSPNRVTTTLEAAPADGSAPAHLLITPSGGQDRLAAVVGDLVLAYRDGTLWRFVDGKPTQAIGGHFGAGVVGTAHDRAIVTIGESGTDHAAGNPSCTLRGATSRHIVFERKTGDAWRIELLPVDPAARTIVSAATASVVGVLGERVIAQAGWEGVGTLEASALGRTRTLVPWQLGDIHDAVRTPDGATVVFRIDGRIDGNDLWQAVRLDKPGALVTVTSPGAVTAVGLTNDRLVGWDSAGGRFVTWRLDGRDAAQPRVILDGIVSPGPSASLAEAGEAATARESARVFGLRAGSLVSAPVDPGTAGSAPVVVMRLTHAYDLAYDALHHRVVVAAMYESHLTILSADIFGADADHPRVLGSPRPPEDANLDRMTVLPSGHVRLGYATRYTAAPHPAGSDVLAANGSGFLSAPDTVARPDRVLTHPAAALASDGAETRTLLE